MKRAGPLAAIAAVIVLVLTVSACTVRPKEAAAIRTLLPMEAVDVRTPADSIFAATSPAERDGVHTVLALSAGGADGAFGAGVLTGWTKNGSRPEFDVVTGVSTGALMAVLAFLGPEYDGMLESFYTKQTNSKIYRPAGTGLLGESLYDNQPLKEQIEAFVTQDILDKIAAEDARGRRLYIATTNLDAGELVIWDMGDIANGGRTNSVQFFQKVLRASAAVPAYFPPVYIKPQRGIQLRQAHVDGGVKEPILVKGFMFPDRRIKKRLYMIINGNTTKLNASRPVENKVLPIAQKSIVEMMRQLQDDTLYRGYVLAENAGADFKVTQIPDTIPLTQESLNFNEKRMGRLYLAGHEIGKAGLTAWFDRPPGLERYEQIARR